MFKSTPVDAMVTTSAEPPDEMNGKGKPFVEFWEDPGLTRTQVRDGWFVTTHSGHMDADSYLWIES